MAALAVLLAALATPIGILANEFVIDFAAWIPGLPPIVSNGILPAALVLAGIILSYWIVKKKYAATNSELIQFVFVFLTTVFIILTITGIWFRGRGMALIWPWEIAR